MTNYAIGIDIGGTKISAGVVSELGLVPGTLMTEPTPRREGPEAILRILLRMVHKLDGAADHADAIGVGTAGIVTTNGAIFSATDAIAGWQGFTLGESLARALDRPVHVLNDVHAAAFGEAQLGAGRGVASFLMVTVGTGVGGSICRGGFPDIGTTGASGSIGHTAARNQEPRMCPCGQTGHVEAYASGPAMERAYFDATGRDLSLREIVALGGGDSADEAAEQVLQNGAAALGVGLADAQNLIDVDLIILGGGVASIGDKYRDAVSVAFAAAALPGPSTAKIYPARLGTEATLTGAGLYATRK
jgi:glucokinase